MVKVRTLVVNGQAPKNLNMIIWEELKVPEDLEYSNISKPYKSALILSLQQEQMLLKMPCGPENKVRKSY